MRSAIKFGTFVLAALAASAASADPIFITTTTITTSGTFDCHGGVSRCTGEGTDSVTITNGLEVGTLTFRRLTSTFDVTNATTPVTIGEIEFDATEGFTFPVHRANPRLGMLRVAMRVSQSAPVTDGVTRVWDFGPGGGQNIRLQMGFAHFGLNIGPNPYSYDLIAYRVRPFPFEIGRGITTITADVGAVPEPTTMVLFGTGLAAAALARRRRRLRDS